MIEGTRALAEPEILSRIPLKRFGRPKEVADLAVFLLSDTTGFVTEQRSRLTEGTLRDDIRIDEVTPQHPSIHCRNTEQGSGEKLIDAAITAPSASNKQPWRFIAVTNRDTIARMGSAVRGLLIVDRATCESRLPHFLKSYGDTLHV